LEVDVDHQGSTHDRLQRLPALLSFQTFASARITLQVIELLYRIKKDQMRNPHGLSAIN